MASEDGAETRCGHCEETSDEFIRVEVGTRVFEFCNWACVIVFAMEQLKDIAKSPPQDQIADLRAKIDDLERTIHYLRSGIQA